MFASGKSRIYTGILKSPVGIYKKATEGIPMRARLKLKDREIFLLSMVMDRPVYGYQLSQMLTLHAGPFI